MDLLTPLQRKLLRKIGKSPLRGEFHLTGGTALAALYMHHRYSVDLDLFTENHQREDGAAVQLPRWDLINEVLVWLLSGPAGATVTTTPSNP